MTGRPMTVLVAGATGSVGRLVVAEAIAQGYSVRALVRNPSRADRLPPEAQVVVGDVTDPESLPPAVAGVEAIVLTPGSAGTGSSSPESVDYGGVRNILNASGAQIPSTPPTGTYEKGRRTLGRTEPA